MAKKSLDQLFFAAVIDLISDTVTQPTAGMREAMMTAPLGDDVFGEDPSVNALEARVAAMFGHEAALYCPSGTMTNQLAIKLHTETLDEVICDHDSHIWQYESAGFAWHSGVKVRPVEGRFGKLEAPQIQASINGDFDWLARTRLVVLENTCNRGGGSVYRLPEVDAIRGVCDEHGLSLHLDGARLMNALVATGEATADWGARFDSISLCLSKGLGAPVGSVLTGSREFIKRGRRFRKILGGGMRQAGMLAAACSYALDHHVERLADDHTRARALAEALGTCAQVTAIRPVATNIVIFDVDEALGGEAVRQALMERGVRASGFGPNTIRLVTHLGIGDDELEEAIGALKRVLA